jgi:SAM-dependent methyltransferase
VKEALQKGYTVTGVEFGQTMVSRLAEAFPKATFYTIDEFQQHSDGVFDVVFLSNVLEHLTTPKEVLAFLVKKLKPGGLLVAEGPLEANRSIANFFRRVAFRMRKSLLGKTATHAPTHVFQANRHNQLQLFQQSGLVTQKLFLQEQPWPFPYSWSKGDAPSRLLLVVVARISVALGPLIPGSGNTFVYIGSKPLH